MKKILLVCLAIFALIFTSAVPANATWTTTAVNVGSSGIAIQTMSGGVRTLYPGQSVGAAGYLIQPYRACFEVNGVRGCNAGNWGLRYLSSGTKYIKRVSSIVYVSSPMARPTAAATITLDSTMAGSLPLAEVAADWSKNTGISVVVAPCSGDNCVKFVASNAVCGNTVVVNAPAGCAYMNADGSCTAEIRTDYVANGGRDEWVVTTHEVGHCLQGFAGSGMFHIDNDRAVMSPEGDSGHGKNWKITHLDKQMVQRLYALAS